MISLIICSTHTVLNPEFLSNISKTIGTEYEIIHIDNSQGCYNIFEAYNVGVERSKGEYLCFMHEDIVFHSQDWGKVIETHLSQPFVGALGVAGGCVVLDKLDWRFYGFGHVYLKQGTTSIEKHPHYYISYDIQKRHFPLIQVAVLDGVWICIRKELFKHIRFDDKNFHDFHLYDSDICMQVNGLGYGVFMTHDIILEHKSEGTFSESYKDSLAFFHEKWKNSLPLVKGMIVTQTEINKSIQKALPRFKERIIHDTLATSIRQKLNTSAAEFTEEERILIDKSAYSCRKRCIKDKKVSSLEAWRLVMEYINMPFARRKKNIIIKYFWYRFLK